MTPDQSKLSHELDTYPSSNQICVCNLRAKSAKQPALNLTLTLQAGIHAIVDPQLGPWTTDPDPDHDPDCEPEGGGGRPLHHVGGLLTGDSISRRNYRRCKAWRGPLWACSAGTGPYIRDTRTPVLLNRPIPAHWRLGTLRSGGTWLEPAQPELLELRALRTCIEAEDKCTATRVQQLPLRESPVTLLLYGKIAANSSHRPAVTATSLSQLVHGCHILPRLLT